MAFHGGVTKEARPSLPWSSACIGGHARFWILWPGRFSLSSPEGFKGKADPPPSNNSLVARGDSALSQNQPLLGRWHNSTLCFMRPIRHLLLLSLAGFAVSCGRPADVPWRDGNFEVYRVDVDSTNTLLGYNHHPGTLGLVEAEVVAAGSTAEWVFVERRAGGRTEFFIVPKEGMPRNHSGTTEGPFSEMEFQQLRRARHLPEFRWRKE